MAASDPEHAVRRWRESTGEGRRRALFDGPSPSVRCDDGIRDARLGRAPRSEDPDYLVGHGLGTRFGRVGATDRATASTVVASHDDPTPVPRPAHAVVRAPKERRIGPVARPW